MKLNTETLLSETMQYLAKKPFHYDDPIGELFEAVTNHITGTLVIRGNTYTLQSAGIAIELRKQLTSHMTKHFSAPAIRDAGQEKAKDLKAIKFAFDNARKRYGLDKAFEQSTVASGCIVTSKTEMYVWITETQAFILVSQAGEKQRVFSFYRADLLELSNYAIKRNVVFIKRNERGGARAGSGKKPAIKQDE
ncbi:hypothetical protein E4625_09680 [Aeromonas hydrophila]|uniref:hypothetical protein n=1 Tax=Aeromonas hydrophila TaxID=644 RepID=UPI000FD18243|nr:hypothetical protein [Aeromonas hydrophila]AZU48389.1 hypothetical protein C3B79_2631 [Aeromonas hydrophila]QBX71081.1 hypothetical protein E4625_09680 [Aeromonas hydrophila]